MPPTKQIHEFLAMEKHEWGLEDIRRALQSAMELEHSTLPLYSFSMYSIRTQNYTAYNLMRSIIMEEMIHMGISANMLAAIGGSPRIRNLDPGYPTDGLPGGAEPDVHARLAPLSRKQVRNFMRVEVPDFLLPNFLNADQMAHEEFPTIGRFYNVVKEAFVHLETEGGQVTAAINAGGPANQIEDDIGIAKITEFNGLMQGIEEIMEQGEGSTSPTLMASAQYEGEESHYTKFAEIFYGRKFVNPELRSVTPDTEASFFRGDRVITPEVINVLAVTADGYGKILQEFNKIDPEGATKAQQALDGLDRAYTEVMAALDDVWNGPIEQQGPNLSKAVIGMTELKVPVRIASIYYPDFPNEDPATAIHNPAIMAQQIPPEIISKITQLYPDEYDDISTYTDLSKPVFFGPRYRNLNAG
jgi:hypothetical protein